MWIRRVFFSWLFPAALALPVWLLIGWGIFHAGGWAFLWTLFVALPSVLIGEVVLALLIRARPTVREQRAVSWRDVAGLTLWHGLTIAVGFFPQAVFGWILAAAIVAFLVVFWSTLWQLWKDVAARGRAVFAVDGRAAFPDPNGGIREETVQAGARQGGEIIVISETGSAGDDRAAR